MNFFQRNKSIFIFGLVIGALFVIIIAIAWEQDRVSEVILTPFTTQQGQREREDYTYVPPEREEYVQPEVSADGKTEIAQGTIEEAGNEPKKIKYRPDKIVSFTDEKGFTPMTDAVHIPQKVLWVNDSNDQITIKELINEQSDQTPVILNPGESFEITVNNTGYWTFREINSGKSAKFYVAEN